MNRKSLRKVSKKDTSRFAVADSLNILRIDKNKKEEWSVKKKKKKKRKRKLEINISGLF